MGTENKHIYYLYKMNINNIYIRLIPLIKRDTFYLTLHIIRRVYSRHKKEEMRRSFFREK